MVRFRLGQAWRREGLTRPLDHFGLELDGVDLLAGASEEPLDKVLPSLLDALSALAGPREPLAEVALPEAQLELLLRRRGEDVELRVASIARPARIVRGPLRVDLGDLLEAALRCTRAWLRESGHALDDELRRELSARLARLEGALHFASPRRPPPGGYRIEVALPGEVAWTFELSDPDDLLNEWKEGDHGALTSLVCGGVLRLQYKGNTPWQASGTPFLMALELSRQAADLVDALELHEPSLEFSPGGEGAPLRVDLEKAEPDPRALARAMFDLGPAIALAFSGRNRAQSRNPWLQGLVERSKEGLARLGTGIQPGGPERPLRSGAGAGAARQVSAAPIHKEGTLRRLRFEKRFEKQNLGSEGGGRLLLGRRGPVVVSPHLATGFSATGELRFRHAGTHGVAADADGRALVAGPDRIFGYAPGVDGARWLRDHDGLQVGPSLWSKEGVLVVSCQGRGAMGLSAATGRELWRLLPPRTQRTWESIAGHRALIADDGGHLHGLELETGRIRFRTRAPLPFSGPVLPWGRKLLATLGRGGHGALAAFDAHSGESLWSCELPLRNLTRPVWAARRIFIAAGDAQEAALLCLDGRGKRLWERRLHLGEAPGSLSADGSSVRVWARNGALAAYSLEGAPLWRVGASGAELPCTLEVRESRGVLLVPGETTRAVDPRGGRVLAEVHTGLGLCDLVADSRLALYALDEEGTLTAWSLGTTLAIV